MVGATRYPKWNLKIARITVFGCVTAGGGRVTLMVTKALKDIQPSLLPPKRNGKEIIFFSNLISIIFPVGPLSAVKRNRQKKSRRQEFFYKKSLLRSEQ